MNLQDILPEEKHHPIVAFLQEVGIVTVGQLLNFDTDELYFVPGVSLDDVVEAIALVNTVRKQFDLAHECTNERCLTSTIDEERESDARPDATALKWEKLVPADEIGIGEAFSDLAGYTLFEKYCNENGIDFLSGLCNSDFHPANFEGIDDSIRVGLQQRFNALFELLPIRDCSFVKDEQSKQLPFDVDDLLVSVAKGCFKKIDVDAMAAVKNAAEAYHSNKPESRIKVQQTLVQLFSTALLKIGNSEFEMRVQGNTLEACGKAAGLTRERIRQIVGKICRRLEPIVVALTLMCSRDGHFCYLDDIQAVFEQAETTGIFSQACAFILKQKWFIYSYVDYLDAAMLHTSITPNIVNCRLHTILGKYADDSFNIISIADQWDMICEDLQHEGIGFLSYQDVLMYLKYIGFQEIGNIAFRDSVSYGKIIGQLVGLNFPGGICTNISSQMKKLRDDLLLLKPNIELPNDRALVARIANDPKVILCDRASYIHIDGVKCNFKLLEEIVEYVETSDRSQFTYNDLFVLFQEKLEQTSDINNATFLHGIIRYYFPNDFEYSKSSLVKHGYARKSISQQVMEILQDCRDGLSLSELQKTFPGLTSFSMASVMQVQPEVEYWGTCHYIARAQLILSHSQRQIFSNLVDELCYQNDGCTSSSLLYNRTSQCMQNILREYGANSPERVFALARANFLCSYKFSSPNISQIDFCDGPCLTREVLLRLASDNGILDMDKCKKIADRMCWAEQTRDINLSSLRNEFIRIDRTRYVSPSKFAIDSTAIEQIDQQLKMNIENSGYLSLQDYHDYTPMPKLEYEWNPALLYGVVSHYCPDFFVIAPQNTAHSSFRFYLVLKSSRIINYEQLVEFVMKQEGICAIQESQMLDFLLQHGLALQRIPFELYHGRAIKYECNKFTVLGKTRSN